MNILNTLWNKLRHSLNYYEVNNKNSEKKKNWKMKYHYGVLSDKKREELKAHENRYIRGIKPAYNDFCVASEDETIVLYRWENDPVQNEYIFWYQSVHMRVFVGEETKREKTEKGERITYLEKVRKIDATLETDREFHETEKEIKEALSSMLSMYIQNVNCLNKEDVVEVIDWEERRKMYVEANPALKRIMECLDKGVETSEADWAAIFGIPEDNKEKQKKIYSGRSDLDAKYYFGALSDEKREELAALQVTNMYGTRETFINRCVVSEDESIVFDHIAYAHNYNDSGDEDECFFSYGPLRMRVYIKKDWEKEVTEKGNIYTEIYEIRRLIVTTYGKREEFLKQKEEILNTLKEVITFWGYTAMSSYRDENDKRIVKVIIDNEEKI